MSGQLLQPQTQHHAQLCSYQLALNPLRNNFHMNWPLVSTIKNHPKGKNRLFFPLSLLSPFHIPTPFTPHAHPQQATKLIRHYANVTLAVPVWANQIMHANLPLPLKPNPQPPSTPPPPPPRPKPLTSNCTWPSPPLPDPPTFTHNEPHYQSPFSLSHTHSNPSNLDINTTSHHNCPIISIKPTATPKL
jgi:hypothetical protein